MTDPIRGTNVRDKAQDIASSAGQKAQEMAAGMSERARDVASAATTKVEGALSSVGQSMTSLADTVRENAPREGVMGSAATAVSEGLKSGGHYLEEHDLGEIGKDFTSLVRSYPLQSLCVAFCCGWLLGLASRR